MRRLPSNFITGSPLGSLRGGRTSSPTCLASILSRNVAVLFSVGGGHCRNVSFHSNLTSESNLVTRLGYGAY